MNIEIAAICDAATANDIGGRMNILGAFDRIFAKFPLVIPQCSAAFRLRYQRSEAGSHQLNLSIEDVVGHPIVPPMQSEIQLQEVGVRPHQENTPQAARDTSGRLRLIRKPRTQPAIRSAVFFCAAL